VAVGQEPDQQPVNQVLLADDDLADLAGYRLGEQAFTPTARQP